MVRQTIIGGVLACVALSSASHAQRRAQKTPPPIVVRPVEDPLPNEVFASWNVYEIPGGAIASTQNESGSAFGVYCGKSCEAFFNFQTSCKSGNKYPALVNSSGGSFSVELKCVIINKVYLLSLPLNETLLDSMSIGGELGVAFPLNSGKFQVARFSLAGALRASSRVLDYAKQNGGMDEDKTLKDYTL